MKMDEDAVSEIVGVLLMLSISIGIFSVVYYSILSAEPVPKPSPLDVIATIKNENLTIIHMGGNPIGVDTKLIVAINNSTIVEDTIDNYLNTTEKQDHQWNIGETIVYPVGNVSGKQVDVKLAEPKSNTLILLANLNG